jgi:hypothetical protein
MRKIIWLFVVAISLDILPATADVQPTVAPAQKSADAAQQPIRTVKGQIISSPEKPAGRLEFDKGFKYVGTQDFILYNVARAEQHFFVDADKDGRIKRMYWVQFEGYLPSNTNTYRYRVNKTANIGGLEFIADAAARNIKSNQGRPDSDGARARTFLESKGYRMASDDVLWQRLVHLMGDPKRDELMIIYMEDLSGTGLTAADLGPDGKAAAQWEGMASGLLDRATKGLKILR